MDEIDDPYKDRKVYRLAAKIAQDGSGRVSAACFNPPRAIRMTPGSGQSWTITPSQVTCPKCREIIDGSPTPSRDGSERA